VHLEEHFGAEFRLPERGVDPDHRDFDEIGRRPLQR
jgi:hypothetical protein